MCYLIAFMVVTPIVAVNIHPAFFPVAFLLFIVPLAIGLGRYLAHCRETQTKEAK